MDTLSGSQEPNLDTVRNRLIDIRDRAQAIQMRTEGASSRLRPDPLPPQSVGKDGPTVAGEYPGILPVFMRYLNDIMRAQDETLAHLNSIDRKLGGNEQANAALGSR